MNSSFITSRPGVTGSIPIFTNLSDETLTYMTLAVCGMLNTHTMVNCYPIHGLLSYVIRGLAHINASDDGFLNHCRIL